MPSNLAWSLQQRRGFGSMSVGRRGVGRGGGGVLGVG
jgi:hypothetical protein